MRYYQSQSTDPYYNLALEEYLTQTAIDEVFMLWRNAPTVVIGKNQNPSDELDIRLADSMGITIVRRMSGGGAVYHDLGNVNFSYISQNTHQFGDFCAFAQPVLDFLHRMGVDAQHIGNNDIGVQLADNSIRKISGNAQYICKSNILHHGTLLFDTDLNMLSTILTPDPSKFEGKGIRSVRSRVANIHEFLPNMSQEHFWQAITGYFALGFSFVEDIDFGAVERLRDEKYATKEWNFGESPTW